MICRASFVYGLFATLVLSSGGCGRGGNDVRSDVVGTASPLLAGPRTISVSLPDGAQPTEAALAAKGSLIVADRVTLASQAGPLPLVVNDATGTTRIGPDARTGSLVSRGAIELRDRVVVTGNVRSASTVTLFNNVTVTGTITRNATLAASVNKSWTVTAPASSQSVMLEPGQQQALVPGGYAAVSVKNTAALRLRTGDYFMDSLAIEPGGRLEIDDAAGPVVVYVDASFMFKGAIRDVDGNFPELLVALLGTTPAFVEAPFQGTLIAPKTKLTVGSAEHAGAFVAKDVEVLANARIVHRPFPWGVLGSSSSTNVRPVLECVVPHGSLMSAVFGYMNPRTTTVSIPFGSSNTRVSTNLRQPTAFLPGRQRAVFAADVAATGTASWTLSGQTVTASARSPVCPPETMTAIQDATVRSDQPNTNTGASPTLASGGAAIAVVEFSARALRSTVGDRPIASARLEMTLTTPPAAPVQLEVNGLRKPWQEAKVTWNCAVDSNPANALRDCTPRNQWELGDDVPGVTGFRLPAAALVTVAAGTTVARIDVTEGVRELVSAGRREFGWALRAHGGTLAMAARESSAPPRLVITYDTFPQGALPTFSVAVDSSLPVSQPTLPPYADGVTRNVVALRDSLGGQSEFVANELVVLTDDTTELNRIVSRFGGVVVTRTDNEMHAVELPAAHVIRIDPTRGDVAALAPSIRRLEPRAHGAQRVSSAQGLGTLAAAVEEGLRGTRVAVNFLMQGADAFDRQMADGVNNADNTGSNPFNWPHFAAGSVQDIGVAEAWRALAFAGRLVPTSIIAILDGGFAPDNDWPSGALAVSMVPFVGPLDAENPGTCNDSCPWHGTSVLKSAMAREGNGFQAAGSGAPVSEAIAMTTLYDFGSNIFNLPVAKGMNADIINMSFGIPVTWWLSWSVLPFEDVTEGVRAAGTIMFASAGNASENVDTLTCIDYFFGEECWESYWYTPCENDGVTCVGGLDFDAITRHDNSNYGRRGGVHIYGPHVVFLPPDGGQNSFITRTGTSYASPFVAGVASLIWAADPSQSANDVYRRLIRTAHTGSPDGTVNRWVNALAGVKEALGRDLRPRVSIVEPTPGATLPFGSLFGTPLIALGNDFEDGLPCCLVEWSTDVDGVLTTLPPQQSNTSFRFPTPGTRVLTAVAIDSAGNRSDPASITVTFVNNPPVPVIRSPRPDSSGVFNTFVNVQHTFVGEASDPNSSTLACSALRWSSTNPADPLPAVGCQPRIAFPTSGTRVIRLTATDEAGSSAFTEITVSVTLASSGPPIPWIESPFDGQFLPNDVPVQLVGGALDPDGDPVQFLWRATDSLGNTDIIGTGRNVTWLPVTTVGECTSAEVTLQLEATDATGNVASAQVTVAVIPEPC
jgi:serine protease